MTSACYLCWQYLQLPVRLVAVANDAICPLADVAVVLVYIDSDMSTELHDYPLFSTVYTLVYSILSILFWDNFSYTI